MDLVRRESTRILAACGTKVGLRNVSPKASLMNKLREESREFAITFEARIRLTRRRKYTRSNRKVHIKNFFEYKHDPIIKKLEELIRN